jgi:hypothetical protein
MLYVYTPAGYGDEGMHQRHNDGTGVHGQPGSGWVSGPQLVAYTVVDTAHEQVMAGRARAGAHKRVGHLASWL